MKAITLWQPWATLIALLIKLIETRGWKPPASWIGQHIVIHAAKRPPREGKYGEFEVKTWPRRRLLPGETRQWKLYGPGLGRGIDLPLGAIVASCTLVDVVPIVGPLDEEGPIPHAVVVDSDGLALFYESDPFAVGLDAQLPYGDFTPGQFAWLLEDIKPTTERCPACWGEGLSGTRTFEPDGLRYEPDRCLVCKGKGHTNPIPAKGKQGLWNWQPGGGE